MFNSEEITEKLIEALEELEGDYTEQVLKKAFGSVLEYVTKKSEI